MYALYDPRFDCRLIWVEHVCGFGRLACVVAVDDRCAGGVPIEGIGVARAPLVAMADGYCYF